MTKDIFDDYKNMSIAELSNYSTAYNIILRNNETEGILISYLDMEKTSERVKVLVNHEFAYWEEDKTKAIRIEKRQFENI